MFAALFGSYPEEEDSRVENNYDEVPNLGSEEAKEMTSEMHSRFSAVENDDDISSDDGLLPSERHNGDEDNNDHDDWHALKHDNLNKHKGKKSYAEGRMMMHLMNCQMNFQNGGKSGGSKMSDPKHAKHTIHYQAFGQFNVCNPNRNSDYISHDDFHNEKSDARTSGYGKNVRKENLYEHTSNHPHVAEKHKRQKKPPVKRQSSSVAAIAEAIHENALPIHDHEHHTVARFRDSHMAHENAFSHMSPEEFHDCELHADEQIERVSQMLHEDSDNHFIQEVFNHDEYTNQNINEMMYENDPIAPRLSQAEASQSPILKSDRIKRNERKEILNHGKNQTKRAGRMVGANVQLHKNDHNHENEFYDVCERMSGTIIQNNNTIKRDNQEGNKRNNRSSSRNKKAKAFRKQINENPSQTYNVKAIEEWARDQVDQVGALLRESAVEANVEETEMFRYYESDQIMSYNDASAAAEEEIHDRQFASAISMAADDQLGEIRGMLHKMQTGVF